VTPPKITIIGGGSVQWSPKIITDIILDDHLTDATVTIHDIDGQAAQRMAAYSRKAVKELDRTTVIEVRDELAGALDGADYVIITISTGGLPAMSNDLSIPERFGIYHTVGDSSGPGGWSRFIRNYPVFAGLGEAITARCPGAMVLNYTNPLTTLTDLLTRIVPGPVIGLCHGLLENLDYIAELYAVEESEIAAVYGGLNHFYWMTEVHAGRVNVLDDLRERLIDGASLTSIAPYGEDVKDLGGFSSGHELATELFHLTGKLPYLGDRHTSEFLPWGITDRERMDRYGLGRTTIEHRVAKQAEWVARVENALSDGFSPAQLQPTRESAAKIISAHLGNGPFTDVGNVANRGQIRNLPDGLVVETPVRIDPNGLTPISVGSLPAAVAGLVAPQATAFQLVVDACVAGDRRLALQALRLEPTTSHLSTDQANDLGTALITANEQYASTF
jgi:alpha-galactosidase